MDMAEIDQARREREIGMSEQQAAEGQAQGVVNVEGKTTVVPRAYIAPVTPY